MTLYVASLADVCGLAADPIAVTTSQANSRARLVLVDATPKEYREKARATVLNGVARAQMALANGKLYARDGKKLVCWNMKK